MGIEPTANSPEKTPLSAESGAKSSALGADPDLSRIIDAWPDLPLHIRAAVQALIGTAQ
jgi:hypothetical protein